MSRAVCTRRGWWISMAAALLCASAARAQPVVGVRAAEVKAAYVARFLNYTEWPAGLPAAVVVGVAGDDEVLDVLIALAAERREGQRPLEVRRCIEGEPVPLLHVLYIGRGQAVSEWTRRVRGKAVLTVSDDLRGLEAGSMLNLLQSEGRIRFEASLLALQAGGIKFSARALALAERVVGGPP